jgi:hypothetical protein
MPYTPTLWVDEVPASTPVKYVITDDVDGEIAGSATIAPVTTIDTTGTPVNAANLNKLEEGLESATDTADAAIPKSIIEAAGDLIVGDSADTPVRFAKPSESSLLGMSSAGLPFWLPQDEVGTSLKYCAIAHNADQKIFTTEGTEYTIAANTLIAGESSWHDGNTIKPGVAGWYQFYVLPNMIPESGSMSNFRFRLRIFEGVASSAVMTVNPVYIAASTDNYDCFSFLSRPIYVDGATRYFYIAGTRYTGSTNELVWRTSSTFGVIQLSQDT